jgi:hypothetical protein
MSTIANSSVSSLPAAPAEVADAGKIRTGLGFKVLPATAPPAAVADSGKIRTGLGFKVLPATVRIGG